MKFVHFRQPLHCLSFTPRMSPSPHLSHPNTPVEVLSVPHTSVNPTSEVAGKLRKCCVTAATCGQTCHCLPTMLSATQTAVYSAVPDTPEPGLQLCWIQCGTIFCITPDNLLPASVWGGGFVAGGSWPLSSVTGTKSSRVNSKEYRLGYDPQTSHNTWYDLHFHVYIRVLCLDVSAENRQTALINIQPICNRHFWRLTFIFVAAIFRQVVDQIYL